MLVPGANGIQFAKSSAASKRRQKPKLKTQMRRPIVWHHTGVPLSIFQELTRTPVRNLVERDRHYNLRPQCHKLSQSRE